MGVTAHVELSRAGYVTLKCQSLTVLWHVEMAPFKSSSRVKTMTSWMEMDVQVHVSRKRVGCAMPISPPSVMNSVVMEK